MRSNLINQNEVNLVQVKMRSNFIGQNEVTLCIKVKIRFN